MRFFCQNKKNLFIKKNQKYNGIIVALININILYTKYTIGTDI